MLYCRLNQFLLIILLAFSTFNSFCQNNATNKKVLFIGNSITSENKMPTLLAKMFAESYTNMAVYDIVYPLLWLNQHYQVITGEGDKEVAILRGQNLVDSVSITLSKKENWSYVILQDGEVPLLIAEVRKAIVEPPIEKLNKMIVEGGGEAILFQPYTITQDYPKQYLYPANELEGIVCPDGYCLTDTIKNVDQEFNIIQSETAKIANKLHLKVAPVGLGFKKVREIYPKILLFIDDAATLSKYGSFLMACIYYQTILGKSPKDLNYFGDIDEATAIKLLQVAEAVFK